MITEDDLIGTWFIVENVLKEQSDDKQKEIDAINSKYSVTYNENRTYDEKNNGIIIGRLNNFGGKWNIEGDLLRMSIRGFSFKRTYKIIEISIDKTKITLSPCDTMYCNIYSNIDHMVIQKN